MSRKLIGVITAVPESKHAQRVLEGVCAQCAKYDYNVAVFAPMAHLSSANTAYINGELNIFELINFDLLDGVIVDTVSLSENNDDTVRNEICLKLQQQCNKPVVSLNMPLGNYPVVSSTDRIIFREIMEHVIDVHGITEICFLTGHKDNIISQERLDYCFEVMKERNLPIRPEWVNYGDFWYSSGTNLAKRIVEGEIPKPQAVVCASDHMAIGLVRYLIKHGVRVPEDIIVTGFEATQEAAVESISVTSFESNEAKTAADAVDRLCKLIDVKEIQPFDDANRNHLHAGVSCGCAPDFMHSAMAFKDSFYFMSRDYSIQDDSIDIGLLLEGYMAEILAEAEDSQECLYHIYLNTYYLRPYKKYYLCLKEDWLAPDKVITKGYPGRMKIVVHNMMAPDTGFYKEEESISFMTKIMLPQMFEEEEEPGIFYFSPVHFKDKVLGYSVIQRELTEKKPLNIVYRNWLRNINTALEMIQTKGKLMQLSISDEMTGAFNRRGMDVHLKHMLEHAQEGDSLLVAVVDMDGLKYVNDIFGHVEGDYGIKQVHKALQFCAGPEEICVRAGGDEFYLFGIGKYTEEDMDKHIKEFNQYLEKINATSKKPYLVGASIGMELALLNEQTKIDNVINAADVKMYASKVERKQQRKS